jgi:hypothetical protein
MSSSERILYAVVSALFEDMDLYMRDHSAMEVQREMEAVFGPDNQALTTRFVVLLAHAMSKLPLNDGGYLPLADETVATIETLLRDFAALFIDHASVLPDAMRHVAAALAEKQPSKRDGKTILMADVALRDAHNARRIDETVQRIEGLRRVIVVVGSSHLDGLAARLDARYQVERLLQPRAKDGRLINVTRILRMRRKIADWRQRADNQS